MNVNWPYSRNLSAPSLTPGRMTSLVPANIAPQESFVTPSGVELTVMPQEVFEEAKPWYKNPYIVIPASLVTVGLIALGVRSSRRKRRK